MKALLLMMVLTFSAQAFSCSCTGPWPVDADPVVEKLLKGTIGADITLEKDPVYHSIEMKQLRSYPTVMDRLALATGMRGTSCHVEGPNGEDHFHCSKSYKSDYEVPVKLANGKDCKAIVRVKASTRRASAKLLSTDC